MMHQLRHQAEGGPTCEAYILVCVSWTFGCSLSRSSPRHGYTATVAPWAAHTKAIMPTDLRRPL